MAGPNLLINLPEELRAGQFSDVVLVWHNQWGFTFDFLTQVQPEPVQVEGSDEQGIATQVVARVRIPPAVIFPLLKALNDNLGNYEAKFGSISHPREPEDGEAQ